MYVRQPRSPLLLPSRPRAQPRDRRITQQIDRAAKAQRCRDCARDASLSGGGGHMSGHDALAPDRAATMDLSSENIPPARARASCRLTLAVHWPVSHMSVFQPGILPHTTALRAPLASDTGQFSTGATSKLHSEARYYRMASYRYAHNFDRALLASPCSTFAMQAAKLSGFSCRAWPRRLRELSPHDTNTPRNTYKVTCARDLLDRGKLSQCQNRIMAVLRSVRARRR